MGKIRSKGEVLSIKQVPKRYGETSKKWKIILLGSSICNFFFGEFHEISICSLNT